MERLFAYDDWANREELARLRAMASLPARSVRVLNHIIGTQWLWLARLQGGKARMAVWPELTFDEAARELDALRQAWRETLAAFDPGVDVAYVNSKGEPWTSSAGDIVMHVILHGAYHRGQIAIDVRDAGEEPAYTDFIHWSRSF